MSDQSAVSVFDNLEHAKQAKDALLAQDFPHDHVVVIAHELESKSVVHGFVTGSDRSATSGFKGAIVGPIAGALLGLVLVAIVNLTTLSSSISLPIQAAIVLILAAAGFVVGSFIGGMSGWTEEEAEIEPYDAQVRAGRVLVVAHGTASEVTLAKRILVAAGALQTKIHRHVVAPADMTESV